jgi:hypothetical protein
MKLDRLNRKGVRSKEATQPLTELTEATMKSVVGGTEFYLVCSGGHLSYAPHVN